MAAFPELDDAGRRKRITIAIQVNGKFRVTIEVDADAGRGRRIREAAEEPAGLRPAHGRMTIQRLVIVPGQIANIVAR